jgi:ABC-type multidrug transport system fused ATPase/permease subunit
MIFDEQKVDINTYFWDYLMENKGLFFLYCCLLFTYPLQRVILPKYYGKLISSLNKGLDKQCLQNAKILLYIFVFVQIAFALFHKVQGMLVPKFSEFSIQKIFSNLLNNRKLNYENLETGEILAKIIKVPNIIFKYLDLLRSMIFSQMIVMAVTAFHYYSISYTMFFTFIGLLIGIITLQIITYKVTMDVELKREEEKDSIYQHFQDLLNNLISVVICKQEKYEKSYLHEKFKPFIDIFNKSLNLNFIMRLVFALFNVISFSLLNILLYREYQNKHISKEQFVSSFIVTYSILGLFSEANYSVRSVVDMFSQIHDMENYFNAKSDLDDVVKQEKENKPFSNGAITFQNVSYQYNENSEFKNKYAYALKNINLTIEKNENVAIVGEIGSGKSTLVKLLLKFFEPSDGTIILNGVPLQQISRNELYDHIFYIPQKPKLMNRTLYENLFYGFDISIMNKEKNVKIAKDMMRQMKLEENIIDIFMEKMDQPLGVDGVKLSGGQRQIVWMIRAMLRKPSIIIFDEPTASLDKENKKKIIDLIKIMGKDKTILIISHDETDASFRQIHMKQGTVIKQEKVKKQHVLSWF